MQNNSFLEDTESAIYKLLLSVGSLNQFKIAKTLNMTVPKTKRTLDNLVKKGWVKEVFIDKKTEYKPMDPSLIQKDIFSSMKKTFEELQILYDELQGLPKMRVIRDSKDLSEIHNKFTKTDDVLYELVNSDLIKQKKHYSAFSNKIIFSIYTGSRGITKASNHHKSIHINDPEQEVQSVIEVWGDNVYFSKAIGSTMGVYIKNITIANMIKFLMKNVLNKQ